MPKNLVVRINFDAMRETRDGLQQQFGRDAVALLDEALDDAERKMARLFLPADISGVDCRDGREDGSESTHTILPGGVL